MSAHETDHKEFARLFSRFFHSSRLIGVHRHGLLTKDVLSGVERRDRAFRVSAVPRADADRVDFGKREHFLVTRKQSRHVVFLSHVLKALFIYIAESVEFGIRVFKIPLYMFDRNVSDSDNTYF